MQNGVDGPLPSQQKRPMMSWGVKIKKKLKTVTPHLGKFRPSVGQCCHQCTPDSLGKKGQTTPSLGFQNLLDVNETHTRYRGWLVRRVVCVLFVSGRKVYSSPANQREDRVWQSDRVQKAVSASHTPSEGGDSKWKVAHLSPYLPVITTCISPGLLRLVGWVMMKLLGSMFCSVQVNLNHMAALHTASQQGTPLVYVCVRQSLLDYVLLPLVLFCHNLRVPYTVCPLQIHSPWIRSVLQKLGVILLPPGPISEDDVESDRLYSPIMTSLLGCLLSEGQGLMVCVSGRSGGGGQWVARVRQAMEGADAPTLSLVPVAISYDCVPQTTVPAGALAAVWGVLSWWWEGQRGSVRIHFSQPFSLKEMCETGRCRMDGACSLRDLLLPVILHNRTQPIFGQRKMSWVLPRHYAPELSQSERDMGVALTLHLLYSTTSCMAVMSTSLISCLLLHRHRKGVSLSALCRDLAWLVEEVLFRNQDVGCGGRLVGVVYQALSLLQPHLHLLTLPSRRDGAVCVRRSLAATLCLAQHAHTLTHTFIQEAVGACAVSAMLCEVAGSGVSSRARGSGVKKEKKEEEFDVALCQDQLTEKALQLCHLLPPGHLPPCRSAHSFALDAVDSLVRCGILVMEEVPRDTPVCDFMKKQGALSWSTTDPEHSDSDYEEQETRYYKLNQPSQCPDMLFFLCSLLAGHLRALCWAAEGLHLLHTPLPETLCVAQIHSHLCHTAEKDSAHYESCSEEVARIAVRTLTDLGVLVEQQRGKVFLGVTPPFQLKENQQKLHSFISQFLYD